MENGAVLKSVLEQIEPASTLWEENARNYLDTLAIPKGSLGDLLHLAVRLSAICRSLKPDVKNKVIVTMAADHGVACEGVSAFPQEVTPQMVYNFIKGGAAINVLAKAAGAKVVVADFGVKADFSEEIRSRMVLDCKQAMGTGNMAEGPAMSRHQCVSSVECGIAIARSLASHGARLLGTGDMGIANTTASSAVLSALCGVPVGVAAGRGTGIDDGMLENKIRVIEKAIRINTPDPKDPLDVLSKVGGFEIGGIAGLILGAASMKIPVVVDGFISTAGALIAKALSPASLDYMIASHKSVEAGHEVMLKELGLTPLLDLNLRLGEGTGAALAMHFVECAAEIIGSVLTFDQAGVTKNAK